jgi:hypothetical protein
MKPKKKKKSRKKSRKKIFIIDEAHGKGMSTAPSNTAFWLDWPPGDEAWAWIDAVATADEKRDPGPLIQLLAKHMPEHAMPFVADLLIRKLTKAKRGPKPLLWNPPILERFSIMVDHRIQNEGLSLEKAVERVIKENSWCSLFSIDRDKLIAHYTGKSGYGRRYKKKRSAIKTLRPDRAP